MDCRRGSAINSSADQDEELLEEEEEVAQFGFFGFRMFQIRQNFLQLETIVSGC
jgi:hypothetical protein